MHTCRMLAKQYVTRPIRWQQRLQMLTGQLQAATCSALINMQQVTMMAYCLAVMYGQTGLRGRAKLSRMHLAYAGKRTITIIIALH